MLRIRAAETVDMSAVAVLGKQLFSDAWSENMLMDCLTQKHYAVTVCTSGGESVLDMEAVSGADKVIGYLISTHVAGEAELLRIGVAPDWRRQGSGQLLMKRLFELCAERETPDIFLEVRASNAPAIALYERFGFSVVGKRKNYYHQPEEDACLMACTGDANFI